MVSFCNHIPLGREKQEDYKFKGIFSYTESLTPAWAGDFISKNKNKKMAVMYYGILSSRF